MIVPRTSVVSTATITTGASPESPAIAPAGTANAGTVYVANRGSSADGTTVTAIKADGTTMTIPVHDEDESPITWITIAGVA